MNVVVSSRGWRVTRLFAFILLAGCSTVQRGDGETGGMHDLPSRIDGGGGGGGGGGGDGGAIGDPEACNKMDILFVIDNSGSMMEEQQNLVGNFQKFIKVLNDFKTEGDAKALDYRVGITTTAVKTVLRVDVPFVGSVDTPQPDVSQGQDPADDGALRRTCGMSAGYVESTKADIGDTFECAASVGTNGSGLEMPLKALELAVTDRLSDKTNEGFLRDNALLSVVILTDEEDCSYAQSPVMLSGDQPENDCIPGNALIDAQHVIDVLDQVKGGRKHWAAAVIAGPAGTERCNSSFGDASPANRLGEFVDLAGENAVFNSICAGDLSDALLDAVDTFSIACQDLTIL